MVDLIQGGGRLPKPSPETPDDLFVLMMDVSMHFILFRAPIVLFGLRNQNERVTYLFNDVLYLI